MQIPLVVLLLAVPLAQGDAGAGQGWYASVVDVEPDGWYYLEIEYALSQPAAVGVAGYFEGRFASYGWVLDPAEGAPATGTTGLWVYGADPVVTQQLSLLWFAGFDSARVVERFEGATFLAATEGDDATLVIGDAWDGARVEPLGVATVAHAARAEHSMFAVLDLGDSPPLGGCADVCIGVHPGFGGSVRPGGASTSRAVADGAPGDYVFHATAGYVQRGPALLYADVQAPWD